MKNNKKRETEESPPLFIDHNVQKLLLNELSGLQKAI